MDMGTGWPDDLEDTSWMVDRCSRCDDLDCRDNCLFDPITGSWVYLSHPIEATC